MTGSAREFAIQLEREFAATMEDVRREVANLAIEGLARVQEKSPVDTGQFRANWLVSIGAPNDAVQEGASPRFWVESTFALTGYPNLDGFPVIYLQNNLPYAARLEDGYSKQAPNGVVALTAVELSAIWNGKSA